MYMSRRDGIGHKECGRVDFMTAYYLKITYQWSTKSAEWNNMLFTTSVNLLYFLQSCGEQASISSLDLNIAHVKKRKAKYFLRTPIHCIVWYFIIDIFRGKKKHSM